MTWAVRADCAFDSASRWARALRLGEALMEKSAMPRSHGASLPRGLELALGRGGVAARERGLRHLELRDGPLAVLGVREDLPRALARRVLAQRVLGQTSPPGRSCRP